MVCGVLDGHEKTVTVVFDLQAVTLLVWSKKLRCFIKAAVGDTFIYQLWKPIYASKRQKKSCRKKKQTLYFIMMNFVKLITKLLENMTF